MINIEKILNEINFVSYVGNNDIEVSHAVQAEESQLGPNTITWLSDKNLIQLEKLKQGIIICSTSATNLLPSCSYIICENPRQVFGEVLTKFFVKKRKAIISRLAEIDGSAIIGENVNIEPFVVIEDGCIIGENTSIGSCTVIKSGTKIGRNVVIGSNNTIGGVGFGYEKDSQGEYVLLPHIGNVVIDENVEIGNNSCIDRAVLGSTVIKKNVKIDNLVHIAHGCIIDENSLVIANSMVAGSTKIGKNCWIAPSSSLINKIEIGDNSVVGIGAVVLKSVPEGDIVVGSPARSIKKS